MSGTYVQQPHQGAYGAGGGAAGPPPSAYASNANAPPPAGYNPNLPPGVQAAHGGGHVHQQHVPMYDEGDGNDETARKREEVTQENTMREMTSATALVFVVLFVVAAIATASTVGSERWFKVVSDPAGTAVSHYGIWKYCDDDGDCNDWGDVCDDQHPLMAVCARIMYARDRSVSATVSAFIGIFIAAWNYSLARRGALRRPLLRIILVGGSVASFTTAAGDTLTAMAQTVGDTAVADGDSSSNLYEPDGALGGWAFALVNGIVMGILMLVLWCGCGRVRCGRGRRSCGQDCCFALKTPEHLLGPRPGQAMNVQRLA